MFPNVKEAELNNVDIAFPHSSPVPHVSRDMLEITLLCFGNEVASLAPVFRLVDLPESRQKY